MTQQDVAAAVGRLDRVADGMSIGLVYYSGSGWPNATLRGDLRTLLALQQRSGDERERVVRAIITAGPEGGMRSDLVERIADAILGGQSCP